MLRKKVMTMTHQEIIGRKNFLERVHPQKISDELVKAISRTLRVLTQKNQEAADTFSALAEKYAVHEGGKPVTCQQRMQEHQQAVQGAEEGEAPDAPTFSPLERRSGFVLENEEAVAEAEQELLQEETEVEVYLCKYQDALTPEMTMADLMPFEWMIDFETNGVQEPVVAEA